VPDSIAQLLAQRSDQYFPLDILAGDDFTLTAEWTDEDDNPVDLTGATWEFTLHIGAFVHTYTGSPEVVVDPDPTTGVVTIALPNSVTTTFTSNTGTYFFRVTLSNGTKTTLMNGDVSVRFNP